jgi:hypothetical protein
MKHEGSIDFRTRSRLRDIAFTTAALAGLIGVAGAAPAGRMLYEHSSRDAYDAAVVVEPEDFRVESLLLRFKTFCETQGAHRKVARLRASTNAYDLRISGNVTLPDIVPTGIPNLLSLNPGYLGTALENPDIAEVLCLEAEATALVRRGDRVVSHQISGKHDSRELSVDGLDLTIVGFKLDAAPVSTLEARSLFPDFLRIFARTKSLPTVDEAAAIRRDLEDRIGVRVFLTLRTDPFFFDCGGPRADVFEVPPAKISVAEFLTKPFIACWPGDDHDPAGGCQLRSTHIGREPKH